MADVTNEGSPLRKLDGFYRFAGQIGSLDSRGRLTVRLEIFARLTPVALDESQIEAA
jgi:transcription antitermination factor NusG